MSAENKDSFESFPQDFARGAAFSFSKRKRRDFFERKKMAMPEIDITQYQDYRDYLNDLVEAAKAVKKSFSYANCAKKLGTTKSYLKLVTQKKRHASQDRIWSLAELFDLNSFDRQYLTFLFLRTTSLNKDMYSYFDDVLRGLKARVDFVGRHQESSDRSEAVFRDSLSMKIYALVLLENFVPDAAWMAQTLGGAPIQSSDAQKAWNHLLETECIVLKNGRYAQNERVFRQQSGLDQDNFKIYQVGLKEAMVATSDLKRYRPSHFDMLTLALNLEDEKRVFQKYVEFRDELMQIGHQSECPKVVHFISNNIFAVTAP